MEHAMETVIFMFAGEKVFLMKEGLRVLIEKEFSGILENQKDRLAVDTIMKDVDLRRSGRPGFQSFFLLTAGLTIMYTDYFVVHMEQNRKK